MMKNNTKCSAAAEHFVIIKILHASSQSLKLLTMTDREALTFGAKKLKNKIGGIDSPILDAEILLCAATGHTKEFIFANPKKKLSASQIKKYKNFISRRAAREPIAYIAGHKEFYGFDYLVSPAVLIPRPETETLINAVLETIGFPKPYTIGFRESNSHSQTIIDVGTGSGAIAITLKKLLPKARILASDISSAALNLAKKNARRLLVPRSIGEVGGAKIIFKKGNLLEPFINCHSRRRSDSEGNIRESSNIKKLDSRLRGNDNLIITANLPYLSRAEWQKCQPEVKKYEPRGALVGGKKGTEIYEKLFGQIAAAICPPLWKSEGGRNFRNPPHHSTPPSPVASEGRAEASRRRQSPFSNEGKIILFIEIGYNQKTSIIKLLNKILHPKKIETFKDLNKRWRTIHATLTK